VLTSAGGGLGDDAACPAPLYDTRGKFSIISGQAGFVCDGALTDSAGGGVVLFRLGSDGFCGGGVFSNAQNYSFPALSGGGGFLFVRVDSRSRYRVGSVVPFGGSPYSAAYNELVLTDSTIGPITVNAPFANVAGERVTIKDFTGTAGANAITFLAGGGNVVESPVVGVAFQSKTWVSDGAGTWVYLQP
jgi:hypothetical protein